MGDTTKKWHFFYNGYAWWLRITDPEQLAEYCSLTDENRYGGAMMNVANWRMSEPNQKWHLEGMADCIDFLNRMNQEDLLTTTGRLLFEAHHTYFKNLARFGFVNINRLGGCNSSSWPALIEIKSDKLIFPTISRKDVTVKTWEWEEKKQGVYRSNYKYHWYAYAGDVRLKDGDIDKWESRAECEKFLDRLFIE